MEQTTKEGENHWVSHRWICHCMTVIRMWLSIEQPLATE